MSPSPLPCLRSAARALRESGAALVAGTSAHVFHGVEENVLYDVGDFLDDYAVNPRLRPRPALPRRARAGRAPTYRSGAAEAGVRLHAARARFGGRVDPAALPPGVLRARDGGARGGRQARDSSLASGYIARGLPKRNGAQETEEILRAGVVSTRFVFFRAKLSRWRRD
jgi:hypothetical protein